MSTPPPGKAGALVEQVSSNGFCTGCGACESIAGSDTITMRMSRGGWLRPVVLKPLSGQVEAVIADVCPGLKVEHEQIAPGHHAVWGPLRQVRAGHATDAELRRQGSSGGGISAIANYLLESGRVSFVAQIAVSGSDPLANELQISRNRVEVLHAAGSRYAPSAPLGRLQDVLALEQPFAFVGKPCDVAALRRYAAHDKRLKTHLVCAISFMCAGIPSLQGTHELLRKLGTSPEKVRAFRYRGDGWPGMARAITHDGQTFETDYNSSWGTVLNRHLQFRCKICPDGTGEFADIVCADAWYGKDGYPDFTEREGRSLILSRTERGEEIVSQAITRGAIEAEDLAVEEIARMQPYQVNRKQMVWGRRLAARMARGSAPHYVNLGLVRAALSARPVSALRDALGTYRRAKGEPQ